MACIEGRAHYLDITGEVDWVEKMMVEHGAAAEKSGVSLCPFAGYDCVPAELGMFLTVNALKKAGGGVDIRELNLAFRNVGGGFPRGTLETILDAFESKTQKGDRPPRFVPLSHRNVAKAALSPMNFILPKWSKQQGSFTGFNFMAGVNIPILCRAATTLGISGSNLVISDRSVVSGKPSIMNGWGLPAVMIYTSALALGGLAMILPPFRSWLRRRLQSYSYGGSVKGKVYLDTEAIVAKGASAKSRLVVPGDAGIYATGLFATGVANGLLMATRPGSKYPLPLVGFHSPVVALYKSDPELIVEQLRNLGAEVSVETKL